MIYKCGFCISQSTWRRHGFPTGQPQQVTWPLCLLLPGKDVWHHYQSVSVKEAWPLCMLFPGKEALDLYQSVSVKDVAFVHVISMEGGFGSLWVSLSNIAMASVHVIPNVGGVASESSQSQKRGRCLFPCDSQVKRHCIYTCQSQLILFNPTIPQVYNTESRHTRSYQQLNPCCAGAQQESNFEVIFSANATAVLI